MAEEALCFLSVEELAARIMRRDVSPVDVIEAHLGRIERLNPSLCAFLEVAAPSARREAQQAEHEIARGRHRGALHGIPYGAKDLFDTTGVRTTYGSAFFRHHVPARDAECIRLLRAAGAILLGKCNTHEFAAATTTVNPHYGTTRNPWDQTRIAGGSSGGSAAAVAAGLCPGALGTDTGGSIRLPAALCGIVGLKPTHGRVSLTGVWPHTMTCDHVGPLARTTADAALLLQAIAGYDPRDPMSRDVPVPDFSAAIRGGVRGIRVGRCPDLAGNAEVDEEVADHFHRSLEVIRTLGATIETVAFPNSDRIRQAMAVITGAEFAEVHRPLYAKDPAGYGEDVRTRVEGALGTQCDDYVRALRERELLRRDMTALLGRVDALVLPSVPCTAPPIGTLKATLNGKEEEFLWLQRPFMHAASLTGCPAIALPMGISKEGLPLSLQVVGRPWEESTLLRIAHAYEEATAEIRGRRPPCD